MMDIMARTFLVFKMTTRIISPVHDDNDDTSDHNDCPAGSDEGGAGDLQAEPSDEEAEADRGLREGLDAQQRPHPCGGAADEVRAAVLSSNVSSQPSSSDES